MTPRISVLVPVYEQWDVVPTLLEHLAAQTLEQNLFEVILADNASSSFRPPPNLPANTLVTMCAQAGSYAARNAAAAIAQGDLFVFTDADCLPAEGWLKAILRAADAADRGTILVGAVELRAAGDLANAYEIYDIIKGIPQQRYASRGYGATANLAVSASLFRDLGGFDALRMSGGDAEFCRRAKTAGARVQYLPEARVDHPARSSWDAIAVKSRRVLGGQIAAGSARRRAAFLLRALSPPVIAWWRIAKARRPVRDRLVAAGVQLRLWGVEVLEAAKLLTGSEAERR